MDLKKLIIVGVIIVAIIFGVQYFKKTDQRAFHTFSVERVQNLFDNLESGRTADQQDAIGYWRVGHPEATDEGKLTRFENFMNKKGLNSIKIKSYEYVSSELIDGDDVVNRYVLLRCKVEGRDLSMIIRHKMPIEWAD